MEKSLKFASELVDLIVRGEKTTTWRLFDDKNITKGDILTFVNKDTMQVFGEAVVTQVHTKTFGTLTDEDWEGHERFRSEKEMYETYSGYYNAPVSSNTEVKVISFKYSK